MAPQWTDRIQIKCMRTESVDYIAKTEPCERKVMFRNAVLTLAMLAAPSLCMICNSKN